MKDDNKTKKQLVHELTELRSQNAELKKSISESISYELTAKEAICKSEDKFRTFFDKTSDGFLIADAITKKFLQGNTAIYSMLGYTEEEIKSLSVYDIHPPKDISRVLDEFEKLAKSEKILAEDLPVLRKDGSIFYADIGASPITIGGIQYVLGSFRDITERKLVQEEIRKNKSLLESIIESTADGILVVNTKGKVLLANYSFAKLWRIPKELVARRDDNELLCFVVDQLNDPEAFLGKVRELYISDISDLDTLFFKDGRIFERFSIPLISNGNIDGRVWSFRDITARKLAENALCESESMYRMLVENIPQKIFAKDRNSVYVSCNEHFAFDLGTTPGEIKGKTDYIYFPQELADKYRADDKQIMESGTLETIEEQYVKGQQVFWVETTKAPLRDAHGNIIGILGIFNDITERKKAEDALRRSELDLKEAQRVGHLGSWDWDVPTDTITWSEEYYHILGFDPTQRPPGYEEHLKVYTLESAARLDAAVKRSLQTGESYKLDLEFRYKEGEIHWIKVHGEPKRDIQGRIVGLRGTAQDITDRKEAEKQLQDTLERLSKAFSATIQAMVSAIESRDPYTAGHQIRTANLALAIATEIGFSQEKIEGVRIVGSIHDLGKLSIPAEILSKPTKLSEIEFSLVKEHARKGYEMLKDVESSWPLAEIVYQHHERMDGSGYPRNLKGEEILIEARIIAVADVMEAMASHRPYRPALGIDASLDEIEKNRGILYDSEVADACLRLFREKGYQIEGT